MSLNPAQKKAAARLYSDLDLLQRRMVKPLARPFGMNIAQLQQWREKLVQVAELIDRAREDSMRLFNDPEAFFELLPDADALLEFAAVEYLPEEFRASLEQKAIDRAALAERKAQEREILIKAGVIKEDEEEGVVDPEVEAVAAELEAEHALDDEVEIVSEDGSALFDPDGELPDFEAGFTLTDDEGEAFPVPPLAERKSSYEEGYAALQAKLSHSMEELMRWVNEEPQRFRESPIQDAEGEAPAEVSATSDE